jgi:hypothetical protein
MTKILLTPFALPRLSDAASAQPCKQFRAESTGAVTN